MKHNVQKIFDLINEAIENKQIEKSAWDFIIWIIQNN